jgi:hypothetical protein
LSRIEDSINQRILALYDLLDKAGAERVSATCTSELNEEALTEIAYNLSVAVDDFIDKVLRHESIEVQGLTPEQEQAGRVAMAAHMSLILLSSVRDNYIVTLAESNPALAQAMSDVLYKGL